MRRYWVEAEAVSGDQIILTGDTLHHIRDVCRMHLGSKFEVIVPGGRAHLVEILSESKKESVARILETREIEPLPHPHIHLAMAIPRFPVFEAVVEKAVELGVKSIHPFFSEFSFIRTREDVWDKKVPRFEKIVQSATQQSGRGDLMEITQPLDFENLSQTFNRRTNARGLFAYEGEARLSAKDGLRRLRSGSSSGSNTGASESLAPLEEVWIFVGAEGGFSEREVQLFQKLGLESVTLGSQVLRVETACVALVSVIKYDLDLMR